MLLLQLLVLLLHASNLSVLLLQLLLEYLKMYTSRGIGRIGTINSPNSYLNSFVQFSGDLLGLIRPNLLLFDHLPPLL